MALFAIVVLLQSLPQSHLITHTLKIFTMISSSAVYCSRAIQSNNNNAHKLQLSLTGTFTRPQQTENTSLMLRPPHLVHALARSKRPLRHTEIPRSSYSDCLYDDFPLSHY
ncbi:hypothetical protein P389DRAFT_171574 [Cystobasidium minutum MCA 4210]|uniref:uncharacterized protein n=1 Tax=Cystobasidium minutum MCA 4210 TaxID=1397322 RepID=UPI0034CFD3CD|eukprot:jgi/Rhomi1/171574/fgenesh1_kg.4_\